ncbi:MAG TPA: S8 family serine peptidase, partial [Polyangiaceae bacterium]|nr:S8 family serine peptidase [Polyangiaceae bacterium]
MLAGCSAGTGSDSGLGTDPGSAAPQPQSVAQKVATPVVKRALSRGAIPGQLIVQFHAEGPRAVSDCVQTALAQRKSLKSTTVDASASLDNLASLFKLRAARALFPARVGLSTQVARTRLTQRLTASARNLVFGQKVDPGNLANTYLLELDPNQDVGRAVAAFQADPHVAFAQPDYQMTTSYVPNDPYLASSGSFGQPYADLWDMQAIGTPTAWDSSRGAGVVVAVVDSGVDFTHPDLVGNLWTNTAEIPGNHLDDDGNGYVDDVRGWSYINNSDNANDENGHGTHVAGTIAAQDNNGIGIVGVAPDARIMPIQAIDMTGVGSTFSLAQGVLYAAQNGAGVINNSWGCGSACPESPLVEQAVKTAHDLGSVVVFAAGNANASTVGFSPQNGPYGVVVGATNPNDGRASFSNFGLFDVTAPGAGIEVTPPSVRPDYGILSLKAANCRICSSDIVVGGQYLRLGGTSMAAPHVAGLAALIRAQHPEYNVEQVRQVIRHSALDLGLPGYDSDYGYGRIYAPQALTEPTPLEVLITTPAIVRQASIPLTGIVRGSGLASYTLEYGVDGTTWTLIASGTSAVNGGSLGNFASSSLNDGQYWLRLKAQTTSGRTYEDRQVVTLDRVELTSPEFLSVLKGGSINITGTAAEPSMTHFNVRVVRAADNSAVAANVTLTGGGNGKVENGLLATWNTAGLSDDFYTVYLDVTTPSGTLTDSTLLLVESTLHDGFPYQLHRIERGQGQFGDAGIGDQHTYADLDGDGLPELVLAHNKEVVVLRRDGTPLPGWPQRIDTNGTVAVIFKTPAVGDIDGDGSPEIVAGNDRGRVFAWHVSGSLVSGWPRQLAPDDCGSIGCATPETSSIALGDIDKNGTLDVVSALKRGQLHVQRADGSELPGFPWVLSQGSTAQLSQPAIADLDGDGFPEIAFTTLFEA